MRPLVRSILDALLARSEPVFSLDDLGAAIGPAPVTPEEIGALIDELERAGRSIKAEHGPTREQLAIVMRKARELETELGRRPSVAEIAKRSGLDIRVVRAVLLFGQVLGR